MEKLKNVPVLRFPEFKGEWEKKLLDDITDKISDGYHGTPVYDPNGDFHFINGNNLVNDAVIINETTKRVNQEQFEIHKKPLNGNTILLSINGTIGSLAFYNNEKIILGKSVCYINLDNKHNIGFIFYQFKTKKISDFFISELTGTTIKNLSLGTIKNTEIFLPIIHEEQKIASFLKAVDERLQYLKKKKTLLEQYKKGIMQKIFSQGLRFKDNIGNEYPDWEEKTLGEVSNVKRGASPRPITSPVWFCKSSKIGWVRISDVTKSNKYLELTEQYLSEEGVKKSRFVPKGNLIMSICATIGKPIYVNFDVCIHDGFIVFDDLKLDKEYLYYYLDMIKLNWYKYGQPGTQVNLNSEIVSNEIIPVPSFIEQTKIANFLSSIDEKINLCNIQIEKTEQYKKGLLQKMFV